MRLFLGVCSAFLIFAFMAPNSAFSKGKKPLKDEEEYTQVDEDFELEGEDEVSSQDLSFSKEESTAVYGDFFKELEEEMADEAPVQQTLSPPINDAELLGTELPEELSPESESKSQEELFQETLSTQEEMIQETPPQEEVIQETLASQEEVVQEALSPQAIVEEKAAEIPEGSLVHVVWVWQESKDCLWNLARKHYRDPWQWKKIYIKNRNSILDPNIIFPKQRIVIPDSIIGVN